MQVELEKKDLKWKLVKIMKNKAIKFYAHKEHYQGLFDPPEPSVKNIPEWYKNQDKYIGGKKEVSAETGLFNNTVKACMPVFDMMSAGYVIKTPADIHVDHDEDGLPKFSWAVNFYTCIESHGTMQYDRLKIGEEYAKIAYKFINPWIVKTPKGYSSLFITPTHRDDLPFYSLPGIVDTDKHPIPVNFPFFIKKDFKGMIPMGTPIIQIIPFKRESWSHDVMNYSEDLTKEWYKAERKMVNRYKTFFRTLKEWN